MGNGCETLLAGRCKIIPRRYRRSGRHAITAISAIFADLMGHARNRRNRSLDGANRPTIAIVAAGYLERGSKVERVFLVGGIGQGVSCESRPGSAPKARCAGESSHAVERVRGTSRRYEIRASLAALSYVPSRYAFNGSSPAAFISRSSRERANN